ncbi:MAG TPA: histidinol-phosphate transaminase [Planctomycetota bacterium]|nr:histidinol-phosphate transaminase [Planctomycetota bacterium]
MDDPAAAGPHGDAAGCHHGGASFTAIGERFDTLLRRHEVIAADVLDAWFPPAPAVVSALQQDLPWLLRSSPPAHGTGLQQAIAEARGIPPANVLLGAGSSDLIYRAFCTWLRPESRVLLLDPSYGEYAHVCAQVVGCGHDRLQLLRAADYALDLDAWAARLQDGNYDLAVLVNPNNPTGRQLPRDQLAAALMQVPEHTRVWIDEAYLDYVDPIKSMAALAAASARVFVCKSMSKVYALSGVRVAFLCGPDAELAALRRRTPPWCVGLPAQLAAVRALQSLPYYRDCWLQTQALRAQLRAGLQQLPGGIEVRDGTANFLLCHLPANAPTAAGLLARCRDRGLFLRDVSSMGSFDDRTFRIAVKDGPTQTRMLAILGECLGRT